MTSRMGIVDSESVPHGAVMLQQKGGRLQLPFSQSQCLMLVEVKYGERTPKKKFFKGRKKPEQEFRFRFKLHVCTDGVCSEY